MNYTRVALYPIDQQLRKQDGLYYKCKFCIAEAKSYSIDIGTWEVKIIKFLDHDQKIIICKDCRKLTTGEIMKRLADLKAEEI